MKIDNREIQSDLVRVVAMMFVICVHVPTNMGERHWILDGVRMAMILTCNGMFFMLSGKYNLRFQGGEDKKAYENFYIKKVSSIVIPFVIYTLIVYVWYMDMQNWSFVVAVKDYLRIFLERNTQNHLWFMYQLIGMLLSAPFLATMLQNLNDNHIKKLVFMGLMWNFVSLTLIQDIMGYTFHFHGWILSGMMLYFVLGYCMDRIITNKKQVVIACILGIMGILITIIQGHYFGDRASGLYDLSPVYIAVNVGIYLFLERVCIIKNETVARIISFVAKHSFGVYLLHFYIIQWIGNDLHISWAKFEMVSYILSVLLVFVISFVASIAIDYIIVKPVRKGVCNLVH